MKTTINTALEFSLDGVNLENIEEPDADFIRNVKKNNLTCLGWTVNDPNRAYYLIQNGIDVKTTDQPKFLRDRLVKLL